MTRTNAYTLALTAIVGDLVALKVDGTRHARDYRRKLARELADRGMALAYDHHDSRRRADVMRIVEVPADSDCIPPRLD